MIVGRDSAVLGYENEGSSHIDGDHRSICKFASPDDPGYRAIKNLLLHIVTEQLGPEGTCQTCVLFFSSPESSFRATCHGSEPPCKIADP